MQAASERKIPEERWASDQPAIGASKADSAAFPLGMAFLAVFQAACTGIFLADVSMDIASGLTSLHHILPEALATLGLAIGVLFEVRWVSQQLRIQREMKRRLDVVGGVLNDTIIAYFRQWSLTSAEQDVAMFTVKGCSIGEIASLRHTAEGTVKTHLNSIYRKAGVQGRSQLMSVLIEDLMATVLR